MEIEFGNDDVASMLDAMKQEDEAGKFSSKYWSPKKEGITKIRFLPKLKNFGESLFYQKHMVHYVNGRPYMCLEQTLTDKDGNVHQAETCPFCQKSKQLYKVSNGDRDHPDPAWKMAGELRAKERYVSRVIVRGNKNDKEEDIEWKPEFYEFGKGIREMIMAAVESGEYGNPLDLKTGRDFSINKKGQKKQTKYDGSMFSGNSTPVFNDATKLKALLAELPKMEYKQLVEFETAEELTKVLKEYMSGPSEDEAPAKENAAEDAAPSFNDMEDAVYASKPAKETSKDEPADDGEDLDALLNSI
jgi:hypothetical protein